MCGDGWGDDETHKFQLCNAEFDYKSFDIF